MLIALIPILLHIFILQHIKFTLWPEMLVYPYLLNHNFLIYKDLINPYPPLFTYILTIYGKLVHFDIFMFKVLAWGIIALIDFLVYFVSYKISKKRSAAFFSLIIFLTLSTPLAINGLWYDLAITPIVLISSYQFTNYLRDKKFKYLKFCFLCLSIGFLIKQQIILLGIFFIFLLLKENRLKVKNYISLILPTIVLIFIESLIFLKIQVLGDFLYWTFYFPLIKSSSQPGYLLLPSIKSLVIVAVLFLPLIFVPLKKNREIPILIAIAALLISFAYPRFDYFHIIPALSILSLIYPSLLSIKNNKAFLISLLFAVVILSRFTYHFLSSNFGESTRFFEPDILTLSGFIKFIFPANTRIYLQNGPDQVLPLSDHLPPKPWADEFPWYMEYTDVQGKVVAGIQKENPVVIYQEYEEKGKYDLGSYKPEKIFRYLDTNYKNHFKILDNTWLKLKN